MLELNRIARFEIAKLSVSDDLAFRVRSRRNKLLGLWAASQLGMNGSEADEYAREIVAAGVQLRGDNALAARIRQDFASRGLGIPVSSVREEMGRLATLAALEHGEVPSESRRKAA